MKTFTLSMMLALFSVGAFSQTYTTGTVTLSAGFTVEFSIDSFTGTVTMTMVGPDNLWLAVAPNVSAGGGMGNAGDDVVVYSNSGLEDRNMTGFTGLPNLDGTQNWTLVSNNTGGGSRTIIATRAINTGDANDYVFPTSAQPLPILWGRGNGSLAFGYHGFTNKGGVVANVVLSKDDATLAQFRMHPNPTKNLVNVQLPQEIDTAEAVVYNYLGSEVLRGSIDDLSSSVDVSSLQAGMYMLRLNAEGRSHTKMFVKQ